MITIRNLQKELIRLENEMRRISKEHAHRVTQLEEELKKANLKVTVKKLDPYKLFDDNDIPL